MILQQKRRFLSDTIDPHQFTTICIISNGSNQPPDNTEVATRGQNASIRGGNHESSETIWHTKHVRHIEDNEHVYKTKPTRSLGMITSPITYTAWSDFISACSKIKNHRRSRETMYQSAKLQPNFLYLTKVHLSQVACTPTALPSWKKPTCRSILLQPTDTHFR